MSTYPAKILLFGEYLVLKGYKALAIPSPEFCASWKKGEPLTPNEELVVYLTAIEGGLYFPLDIDKWKHEMAQGYYLESNIPRGAGLGSSGAYVAALYDRYALFREDGAMVELDMIKQDLARIESFFHGQSSGTDPLVSYTACPILLDSRGATKVSVGALNYELLDSGRSRETKDWIALFQKNQGDPSFAQRLVQLGMLSDDIITAVLEQRDAKKLLIDFGELQLKIFKDFFPRKIYLNALEALSSGNSIIKLCGSGGGGYFLRLWL